MNDVIDQVIFLGILGSLVWFGLFLSGGWRKRDTKPTVAVDNPHCVVILQCIEVCEHCDQRLGSLHLPECPYTTTTNKWWMVDEKS